MDVQSEIVPDAEIQHHRGRRNRAVQQVRLDVYRELVGYAEMTIARIGILHRTFSDDDHPLSWLYLYRDNPCLHKILKKLATKDRSINQLRSEDIRNFYDNLTHDEFKLYLQQFKRVEVPVNISVTEPNYVSAVIENISCPSVQFTPVHVTLETFKSLPLEDRILRVLPPLSFSTVISAHLEALSEPPKILRAYTSNHLMIKSRAFSILVYAPPHSGKTHFKQQLSFRTLDTDEFDSWNYSSSICFTNMSHLLGYGVINIAVIPSYARFVERCKIREIGRDGLYRQWYTDILQNARNADWIYFSDDYLSAIPMKIPSINPDDLSSSQKSQVLKDIYSSNLHLEEWTFDGGTGLFSHPLNSSQVHEMILE